mmetsp:Transcript_34791/g.86542  ORF Transcript_34791/g.86542 Transcript_34791/m.86542 type:complete len:224 (-) Transcript_34791:194-865(-)
MHRRVVDSAGEGAHVIAHKNDQLPCERGDIVPLAPLVPHLQPPRAVLQDDRQHVPVGVRRGACARLASRKLRLPVGGQVAEQAHEGVRLPSGEELRHLRRRELPPPSPCQRAAQRAGQRDGLLEVREERLLRTAVERRPRVGRGDRVGRGGVRLLPRPAVAEPFLQLEELGEPALAADRDVAAREAAAAARRQLVVLRQAEEAARHVEHPVDVDAVPNYAEDA